MEPAAADKPFLTVSPPSLLGIPCPWAFFVLQPFYAIAWLSFGDAAWFIPACAVGDILILVAVAFAVGANRFEFSERGIKRISVQFEIFVPWKAIRSVELHAETGLASLVRHDHLRIITRDGILPRLFVFSIWTGFDKAVRVFQERGLIKSEVAPDYSGRVRRRVPLTLLVDLCVITLLIAPTVLYSVRNTQLIIAAGRGHSAGVQLLLAVGADVNARDRAGKTALMCATASRKEAVVQLLLKGGADTALTDLDGKTARDYAQEAASRSIGRTH